MFCYDETSETRPLTVNSRETAVISLRRTYKPTDTKEAVIRAVLWFLINTGGSICFTSSHRYNLSKTGTADK